ncbi:MAG: G8 domain-containing protein, partial [Candidatus Binatia bacterium]
MPIEAPKRKRNGRYAFVARVLLALAASAPASFAQQPGPAIVAHTDRIPDFGASPTIRSVFSGPWSRATTWSPARVPTAGDVVSITGGTVVTFDTVSKVKTVSVQGGGVLRFRPDVVTSLTVTNLLVREGATLEVGTVNSPVAANVTATITIANQPTDTANDPNEYGTGLIALGKVTMHGARRTPTFARLASEPRAGDPSLRLADTVSGWRTGDRLFLPDSRQLGWNERDQNYVPRWEYATVAGVSTDGRTLTLSAPLAHDHPGSHVLPGDPVRFLPHVANLSRNLRLRSESAAGTRGHTLFTARADVDIRYVSFAELGRTLNVGSSVAGRYPLHLHHLVGPVAPQPNGHQFTVVGNVIHSNLNPYPYRWGL